MHDQPKYEAYEGTTFFGDARAMRGPVEGTVARGHLKEDVGYETGLDGAEFVAEFPMPVDRAVLDRGQERYNVYCAPCHDQAGYGRGMIVQRGYKQPQSFHSDRVRALPPGYFVNVMTNGFVVMPSYAHQVPVADRWAIAAYVRALQLSQHASLADVPASERGNFED